MSVNKGRANKVLSQSFVENNADVNEDEATALVVKCALKIRDLEQERKDDAKVTAAKEVVKDISAGYSSAIKYEKAKISFLLEKITEIQDGDVNPGSGANS